MLQLGLRALRQEPDDEDDHTDREAAELVLAETVVLLRRWLLRPGVLLLDPNG